MLKVIDHTHIFAQRSFRKSLLVAGVALLSVGGIAHADSLTGTTAKDFLIGGSGASTIAGRGNNDVLFGEATSGIGPNLSIGVLSTNAGGVPGDNASGPGTLSPDGKFLAFVSSAKNLVSGDLNLAADVFLKDLSNGAIRRISTTSAGGEANNRSFGMRFSPDGSKIVFVSGASNLVGSETNKFDDIFLKDIATGAVRKISVNRANKAADSASYTPVFSPDGKKIAFMSYASNLVTGDKLGHPDIFVKDLSSGAVTRVSTNAAGAEGNGASSDPMFSPDGGRIVFSSNASNLVGNDTNGVRDIFVKDLASGAVSRVSVRPDGVQGNGPSDYASFSPNGVSVVFQTRAENLVTGTPVNPDTNLSTDIYLKNLKTGKITLVSRTPSGRAGNGYSLYPAFSPDGTKVAFDSNSSNLVTGDTNAVRDVFLFDLQSLTTRCVSVGRNGHPGNGGSDASGRTGSFSTDGRRLVFTSSATNFALGDSTSIYDVYIATLNESAGARDVISGDSGNDKLFGATGDDSLRGGSGADWLFGGSGTDTATYSDSPNAVTIRLSNGTGLRGDAEGDRLFDIENVNGSAQDDLITGEGGANRLTGLKGGDQLTGNGEGDVFVYTSLSDSPPSDRDRITDFDPGEGDMIDLFAIDANTRQSGNNSFIYIGNRRFSGKAGELRFDRATKRLEGDVNGGGVADLSITVSGVSAVPVAAIRL